MTNATKPSIQAYEDSNASLKLRALGVVLEHIQVLL